MYTGITPVISYFRGNVTNNYISFAGYTWRILRTNTDGSIRIIMQDGINDNAHFQWLPSSTTNIGSKNFMYFSNSNIDGGVMKRLYDWYNSNIGNNSTYLSQIAPGSYYFCEQATAAVTSSAAVSSTAGMTIYSNYTPTFKCTSDSNNYGSVDVKVGLITYDEVVYAGGYPWKDNDKYFLNNGKGFWTMSTAGYNGTVAIQWLVNSSGGISTFPVNYGIATLRPVINIKKETIVTGTGTVSDPYIIH